MGKTILERIQRFCEKYPEPRQYGFKLRWSNSSGEYEKIMGDSENALTYWGNNMYKRTIGKPLYAQHYRYDEETQLMECSYETIKCTTPKENENRRWVYAERYFIPKEEKVLYCQNGAIGNYIGHYSYGDVPCSTAKKFFQAFTKKENKNGDFLEAFNAITDGNPDLPPRYVREDGNYYPWIMHEWIVHKRVERKNNIQPKIDELVKIELTDKKVVNDSIRNYKVKNNYSTWDNTFAYYDKMANVFRLFTGEREVARIYLDAKNKTTITKCVKGKWVPNGSFTEYQFDKRIVNVNDMCEVPGFAYLKKIQTITLYDAIRAIRNPEIEQLINMNCENIATIAVKCSNNVGKKLGMLMGEADKGKKPVCKKYHLTQKQINYMNGLVDITNRYYNYSSLDGVIETMSNLLGTVDLSSLDLDSFKMYYSAAKNFSNRWNNTFYRLNLNESETKTLFKRLANMQSNHSNAIRVFQDSYNMYCNIRVDNRPEINFCSLKKYEDIVRVHDILVQIQNAECAERQRLYRMQEEERNKELEKKMAKLNEKRKELNYDDGKYIIIVPEKLGEISTEGSVLRHCVGGYQHSHARGDTTILFLRKKSEPTTPFYTIELTNGMNIAQIHGFGNKWLGNDPDAIPSVMKWLKQHGIKCSKEILCSTAKGYSGYGATLVELPKI